jgi:hypothetical protein
MSIPLRQFLAYRFLPGARFGGQLTGALERIESGGAMRILDALFVGREPESGELVAVSLTNEGAAGMVGRLLSFRLDASSRASTTKSVLEGRAGSLVSSLAETVDPGGALLALLVEHSWAIALNDAIARTGGHPLVSEFVAAADLLEAGASFGSIAHQEG